MSSATALMSNAPTGAMLALTSATAVISPSVDAEWIKAGLFNKYYFSRQVQDSHSSHAEDLSDALASYAVDNSSLTNELFEPTDNQIRVAHETTEKVELLESVRELTEAVAAASGDTTFASGVVKDAVALLQYWPNTLPLPDLDIDDDGLIVLDVIDENGLALVGFDLLGSNHRAAFSTVSSGRVTLSGTVDTSSPTDMINTFSHIHSALTEND